MIKGTYPVGAGKDLYLDSKTGEGFPELIKLLRGFFSFQVSTRSFPGFAKEDLEQEMLRMALEAIPRYDATKQANLITFLQNHIKNRIINMCKFYAEKRRCASYINIHQIKVRCNKCRGFFKSREEEINVVCPFCNQTGELEDQTKWKHYNLIAVPSQFTSFVVGDDDVAPTLEISPDLQQFAAVGSGSGYPLTPEQAIDVQKILGNESEQNKLIIQLICQGYGRQEVSDKTGVSTQRIVKILKDIGEKFAEEKEET